MSIQFTCDRLMFAGLPFGDLRRTADRGVTEGKWAEAFTDLATDYELRAITAVHYRQHETARTLWRWSAIAHQGASFATHLAPQRHRDCRLMQHARRRARMAFRKSLIYERGTDRCRAVTIAADGREFDGYLSDRGGKAPCIVLVNGLDSIAEVELQAFGRWFSARGATVLSLNVPVDYVSADRAPRVDVRAFVPGICDWLQTEIGAKQCGIFGVSFGGHLVAQFLASDRRVVCGAAVCPPAFIGRAELELERIRVMWACAVGRSYDEIDTGERDLPDIRNLGAPQGEMFVIGCRADPIFGEAHLQAYREWGRGRVTMRILDAEHVATSLYSDWLPELSDWMHGRLAEASTARAA